MAEVDKAASHRVQQRPSSSLMGSSSCHLKFCEDGKQGDWVSLGRQANLKVFGGVSTLVVWDKIW
jgi:hypothetical protein